MSTTIASWNVNSVKARAAHVTTFLADTQPDILFLQELKGDVFPDLDTGYHVTYVGQKAYNGVAILSKTPVTILATHLPGDDTDTQARYIEAEWNGLRLINIYLPNGNPIDTEKFDYKLAWMRRLYTHLASLITARIPFLVGGDFNVIPANIDCYDPDLWRGDALFHPKTITAFRRLINLGLTDALRVFNAAPETYTFWDYQAGAWPRNRGIRIDHFLTSPAVTDRLISCTIDKAPRGWDSPSDHTPIIVTISE